MKFVVARVHPKREDLNAKKHEKDIENEEISALPVSKEEAVSLRETLLLGGTKHRAQTLKITNLTNIC